MDMQSLRRVLGAMVNYKGSQCEVIEVLEDGPAIVLRCLGGDCPIQGDMHGEAHRRTPSMITLPVYLDDEPNPFIARLIQRVS